MILSKSGQESKTGCRVRLLAHPRGGVRQPAAPSRLRRSSRQPASSRPRLPSRPLASAQRWRSSRRPASPRPGHPAPPGQPPVRSGRLVPGPPAAAQPLGRTGLQPSAGCRRRHREPPEAERWALFHGKHRDLRAPSSAIRVRLPLASVLLKANPSRSPRSLPRSDRREASRVRIEIQRSSTALRVSVRGLCSNRDRRCRPACQLAVARH